MKSDARRFIQWLLSFFGLELHYKSKILSLDGFFFRLKLCDLNISVVYDIGAHKGEWAKKVRKVLDPDKIIMFEPNSIHNHALAQIGNDIFNIVLSDSERELYFYSLGETGDSYYREVNILYRNISPKIIYAQTLDNFRETHSIPQPDLIKIDTQGSEVDILIGAVTTLKLTKVVVLEIPIVLYNEGAPKFEQYIEVMENNGFTPFDFVETHIVNDILVQIDIAFIKDELIYEILNKRW